MLSGIPEFVFSNAKFLSEYQCRLLRFADLRIDSVIAGNVFRFFFRLSFRFKEPHLPFTCIAPSRWNDETIAVSWTIKCDLHPNDAHQHSNCLRLNLQGAPFFTWKA